MSPAAYDFVICGLSAVWKLTQKPLMAFCTCTAIPRAAFTVGPKNMLSNTLSPWVNATAAMLPKRFHPAKPVISRNSAPSHMRR